MSVHDLSLVQLGVHIRRHAGCYAPSAPTTDIRAAANGKWRGILLALGFDASTVSGKHGPCPMCAGKDRFRFDDKGGRGTWICARCGAGDGFALVMARSKLDFRGALKRVESVLGTARSSEPKPQRSDDARRSALNALWQSTSPVSFDDPVGLYLRRRVGIVTFPACVRSAPWVRYQGDPVSYHPCMVAMVRDAGGCPVTLHRTYLSKTGSKADVEEPRRLMPGPLPLGSSVRLSEAAEEMGVAEGVETALSAAYLFAIPVWAAVSAGSLAEWVPPDCARRITIFGDNDASFTGQAAAFRLAHRLRARGLAVNVELPAHAGHDWNDVLQQTPRAA